MIWQRHRRTMKVLAICAAAWLVAPQVLAPAFSMWGATGVAVAADKCQGNGSYKAPKVGGVKLDKAATFLADMRNITGAYYDSESDRIVFVGQENTTAPQFEKDDLAVAVRAIFFRHAIPAVSIDWKDATNPFGDPNMLVRMDGGIEDTQFGKTLLDADYMLKQYIHGYRANGQALTSRVPGYVSVLDRYIANGPGQGYSNGSRTWISPKLVSLRRDAPTSSFVFDQVQMQVLTENTSTNADPAWTKAFSDFAKHQTDHYDEFASETPEYFRTKQLAKITAVVKWIADTGVATDMEWARGYTPRNVPTPREVPRLTTPYKPGPGNWTYAITGGVAFNAGNTYAADDGRAATLKRDSEAVPASDSDVHWSFSSNGQAYESVAVSGAVFRSLGAYRTSAVDLALPTAASGDLEVRRSYSSVETGDYGLGRGWQMMPARLLNLEPGADAPCVPATGFAGPYPLHVAFDTPAGGRESFTYSCAEHRYVPDDAGYHSRVLRDDDGGYTVRLTDGREQRFAIDMRLMRSSY
jgi:hypothetical protein